MVLTVCAAGFAVLGFESALAETIRWAGVRQTAFADVAAQDWFEPSNWDLGRIPAAGDDVVITGSGSSLWFISLTNATPHLASLTMAHGAPGTAPHQRIYVRVKGWETKIWADTISIGAGSSVNIGQGINPHQAVADNGFGNAGPSNRIWIVGNTLTIAGHVERAKAGALCADGGGYRINNGPGYKCYPEENTLGETLAAGHGGMGVTPGFDSLSVFQTYGSAEWPLDPGTGGPKHGTPGGGAILIELSGDLVVNGWIAADAGDPGTSNLSVGSGGSVCITCRTLTGTGSVDAKGCIYGGYSSLAPWSGGGRIAVHYDTAAQQAAMARCQVRVRACGGSYGYGSAHTNPLVRHHTGVGCSGTVWFPDRQFLDSQRPYRVAGVLANLTHDGSLVLEEGFDISGGLLAFRDPIAVRIRGSSTAVGDYSCQSGFDFETAGSSLEIGGDLSLSGANVRFRAGGALTVVSNLTLVTSGTDASKGGQLWLVAGPGEMGEVTLPVAVGGTLTANAHTLIKSVCDPTTGSIVSFKARDIDLRANSWALADAAGFSAGSGPGSGGSGYGGTHAGRGAVAATNAAEPYGRERLPVTPGSGGRGGAGGGVIFMEAEKTLTCNGGVNASGQATSLGHSFWHAGAGGSIALLARTFAGVTGALSADGGDATGGQGHSYGGGGGRIAIRAAEDLSDHATLTLSARGGSAGATTLGMLEPAEDGTIYWGKWQQGLTLLVK